jgi:polar amino acid transport system substrate-binding protein
MTETNGFRRRFMAPAAGGLAALGAFAFGRPAAAQGADARATLAATSMIEEVKRRGTLRVGMSTFVPWAFRNRAGELIGYEIDVANRLAQDMAVRAEFVPTAWDGIVPALLAGRFDAIIGGMSITPARNLNANFTSAYSATGVDIAASRRLAQGMTSFDAWNRPNVTLVGRRGTSGITAAQRLSLGSQRAMGTIDRLSVTPDRALAVDYKSNRLVPEAPEAVP